MWQLKIDDDKNSLLLFATLSDLTNYILNNDSIPHDWHLRFVPKWEPEGQKAARDFLDNVLERVAADEPMDFPIPLSRVKE